jgi:hypothetical protein
LNKNKPDLAMQALDPTVGRFPQAPDPYYYRAMAELQLQQMDKAKADLEKFLAIAPPGSPEIDPAKTMLEQIKDARDDRSTFVAAPRKAGDRVIVNPNQPTGRGDAVAAGSVWHMRR